MLFRSHETVAAVERFGGATDIGSQLREPPRLGPLVNSVHQHAADAASRMVAGHEEVIDVAAVLQIRITHDLIPNAGNERTNSEHTLAPEIAINLIRCPGVDLFNAVVTRGDQMNRRMKYAKQRRGIFDFEFTDAHGEWGAGKGSV